MFGSGNLFYISDHRLPEKGALVLVSWKNSYSHQEYEDATGNYLEAGEALLVDTSPAVFVVEIQLARSSSRLCIRRRHFDLFPSF